MKAKPSAFEKRVKRHVLAKDHSFFVPVNPGFTDLCHDEMTKMDLEGKDIRKIPGGVEFTGSFNDCYRVNLFSRTGNRVLMRVLSFKATNFKSMEKKTGAFPWDLFLNPQIPIEITVSTKRSRLIHTKAISEKMEDVIYRVLSTSGMNATFDESKTQRVFVRVVDDEFTISLDSTGENLHRRNLKTIGGPAPIRETIASALLTLSGFEKDKVLIDPMCGTGTFSMEAYMIATSTPPGYYRDFAFQDWPGYRDARFKHIRKKASESINVPEGPFIYSSDKNGNLVTQFRKCVTKAGFEQNIDIQAKDFFKFQPDLTGDKERVVIFNPPFGQRMGSKGDSDKIVKAIIEKLRKDYKGCTFGIILPFRDLAKKIPFKCKLYSFSHGGLKLTFAVSLVR